MPQTTTTTRRTPFLSGGPEALFRVSDVVGDSALVSGSMHTGPWMSGPDGSASLGSLGVLVDDALAYAVLADRPEGSWAVSTEISVELCAAPSMDGSALRSTSSVVARDATGGLARGEVRDERGRVVAFASQRLRFSPGVPATLETPGFDADRGMPAIGVAEPGRPRPGVLETLGATVISGDARARLALPSSPWLVNPMGNVHGGILLCVSEVAGLVALQSEAHPLATTAVHISYVRPAPLRGEVTVAAEVLHRGRTLGVAQVRTLTASGKVATVATVTAQRPAG
ncbi:PaaI family thioesterase [Georgenia sp. AZ-5]|uniref:PaaI family thioesterase n=1 Tax=Georgenia sp. AZ-5 TaxID=3367526 RepID=UPI0037540BBA